MRNVLNNPVYGAPKSFMINREKWINWYVKISQYIAWLIIYPLTILALKIEVVGRENLKNIHQPFILISNHFSMYDSFLFRIILGPFTDNLPLRFMAVDKFDWRILNFFYKIGIVKLIYLLFGVFTVVPGQGIEKNLNQAKAILKAGGNIVIYPEGKITKNDGVGIFKKGTAILVLETKVPIIPLSFKLGKKYFYRLPIQVNIGTPIYFQPGLSAEEITARLYSEVDNLHKN